jgi:hypothetical protein
MKRQSNNLDTCVKYAAIQLKQALNTSDVFRKFPESAPRNFSNNSYIKEIRKISVNRGEKIPIPIVGSQK